MTATIINNSRAMQQPDPITTTTTTTSALRRNSNEMMKELKQLESTDCSSRSSSRSNSPSRSATTSQQTCTPTTSTAGRRRRAVSFGQLQVYEFPQILGDNPAVSDGAPVTLDWHHENQGAMDIAVFEYRRKPRRTLKQLQTTALDREQLLKESGYTATEIQQAAQQAASIRRQRETKAVLKSKGWDKVHVILETLLLKTLVNRRRESARALLKRHHQHNAALHASNSSRAA